MLLNVQREIKSFSVHCKAGTAMLHLHKAHGSDRTWSNDKTLVQRQAFSCLWSISAAWKAGHQTGCSASQKEGAGYGRKGNAHQRLVW